MKKVINPYYDAKSPYILTLLLVNSFQVHLMYEFIGEYKTP